MDTSTSAEQPSIKIPYHQAYDAFREAVFYHSKMPVYLSTKTFNLCSNYVEPAFLKAHTTMRKSLKDLMAHLDDSTNKRVEICGVAGTGKTTLLKHLSEGWMTGNGCRLENGGSKPTILIDLGSVFKELKDVRARLKAELTMVEKFLEAKWVGQKYGETTTKEELFELILSNPQELMEVLQKQLDRSKEARLEPGIKLVVFYQLKDYSHAASMAAVDKLFEEHPQIVLLLDNVDDAIREGDPVDVQWLRSYLTDPIENYQRNYHPMTPMSGVQVVYAVRESLFSSYHQSFELKGVVPSEVTTLFEQYFQGPGQEAFSSSAIALLLSNPLLSDLCRNPFFALQICVLMEEGAIPNLVSSEALGKLLLDRLILRNFDSLKDRRSKKFPSIKPAQDEIDVDDVRGWSTKEICSFFEAKFKATESDLEILKKEQVRGSFLLATDKHQLITMGFTLGTVLKFKAWITEVKNRRIRAKSSGELHQRLMSILARSNFKIEQLLDLMPLMFSDDRDLIWESGLLATHIKESRLNGLVAKWGMIHPFFDAWLKSQEKADSGSQEEGTLNGVE